MSKKKQSFNLNVGTSSILFIFVILTLISFAVLSLVSALTDYRLSKDVANNTTNYYEASGMLEEQISEVDNSLKDLYDTGISRAGYFEQTGTERSFAYPISDLQSLNATIKILYPENEGEPFYEITSWMVITTGSIEYDDTIHVFH